MDQRIQSLWRKHHADPADLAIIAQLFNLLMASGEVNLAKIVELRDGIDLDNTDAYPLIKHISQYLYKRGIPYDTPKDWQTREFNYSKRRENESTWALVELDETAYYDDLPESVIAVTGVYLVNTGAPTYIASTSPSILTIPMYPNVISFEETDTYHEELVDEWARAADVSYMSYHHLPRIVVDWFWIPYEDTDWEQYCETEQEFIDSLVEAYLQNRAL